MLDHLSRTRIACVPKYFRGVVLIIIIIICMLVEDRHTPRVLDDLGEKMLELVAQHLKDVSVLRRLVFAASNLPDEVPGFGGIVVEFATAGKVQHNLIDADTVAALMDNIQLFDERAFESDATLTRELVSWKPSMSDARRPLGLVLITPEKSCTICGQKLTLRRDRSASITVYDDNLGPVPGTHFHKICSNRTCNLTPYFGYYTIGSKTIFNANWRDLKYFVSSLLTAFSLSMLKRIDVEIVIGQLSYKQIADTFNQMHSVHLDMAG